MSQHLDLKEDQEINGIFGKHGNYWKPIYDGTEKSPKNGYDIFTTINVNLQDITEHALLKGLIRNDADYGCVILMDVETGDIKSISNLSKNDNGNYMEWYLKWKIKSYYWCQIIFVFTI